MKYSKIIFIIISNFLIFYLIYKVVFKVKIVEPFFEILLSLSCLIFSIVVTINIQNALRRKIWFIISEWILGITTIFLLKTFLSGKFEFEYWVSIFVASFVGGFLTIINFSKTFGKKLNFKEYALKLLLLTLTFPFVEFTYFKFLYQKKFYDLSFFVFIPEIIIVIIWQTFNFLEIKKGCR